MTTIIKCQTAPHPHYDFLFSLPGLPPAQKSSNHYGYLEISIVSSPSDENAINPSAMTSSEQLLGQFVRVSPETFISRPNNEEGVDR